MDRAALQKWTVSTDWAAVGQVTVVNAGEIASELNMLPAAPRIPQPPPPAF
jgi:hypothetical protein